MPPSYANGGAPPPSVPLERLRPEPQMVDCPHCHKTTQTRLEGRGKGMKLFMNIFWWPLPGRRTWWETLKWHCGECGEVLATQKNGKELVVGGDGKKKKKNKEDEAEVVAQVAA